MNTCSFAASPAAQAPWVPWALAAALLTLANPASAFTKSGNVYTTNGSQTDVNGAIAAAADGDIVMIPPGTFTWGDNGSVVGVSKAIQLVGSGQDQTTIQVSASAGSWGNAVIRLSGQAVVRDFTVRGATGSKTPFSGWGAKGWRITNINYVGVAGEGYFCYAESYGLIDNCTIQGMAGNTELIFSRGPTDSWQTDSSMGTTDAVYIENCTFRGTGYVCDFNSNSRGVVRFCTIEGPMKVDGHGVASNYPARGVRQLEIYNNTWTWGTNNWTNIEFRGGTGMIFANRVPNVPAGNLWFWLKEYGCTYQYSNFNNTYQTPVNYPVLDQIGVGKDPRRGGSEPLYIWDNKAKDNKDMILNWYADLTNAINLYRVQTGNPTASFGMRDIVAADRDYFRQDSTLAFNGSSGVGMGTKAQMQAIVPSKVGVGFWVTDEGDWNTLNGSTPDGQLYAWNGTAWVLKYRPLTYPHPARNSGAPSNARIRVQIN